LIKSKEFQGKYDFTLLITVIVLVMFGIVMVYSASWYSALEKYDNKYYFMYKQIIGGVLGIIALVAISFTDYHILNKLRYIILAVSIYCYY